MESNGKIVFQTSNRAILFWIMVITYISENMYYGWNETAVSNMERWWDFFVVNLAILSMFVKKLHFVIVKKEI